MDAIIKSTVEINKIGGEFVMKTLTLQEQTTKRFPKLQEEKILMTTCSSPKSGSHDHDFLELTYVLQGKANHVFGEETSVIGAGDYFIVDYGVRHEYTQIGSTPFTVINCLFLPRLIDETLDRCRSFQELAENYLIKFNYRYLSDRPTRLIYHDHNGRIGRLITALSKEYNEKRPGHQEMMRCQLIEILIETMRELLLPLEPAESDLIQYITDQVEKNFMEKLSLKDLADKCCYSLAYVSKRFKETTGVTFQHYLQSVRIRESCRLMANTTKKIAEIGDLVGYSDPKFFNIVFKNHMGMTPRDYKRLCNQKGTTL